MLWLQFHFLHENKYCHANFNATTKFKLESYACNEYLYYIYIYVNKTSDKIAKKIHFLYQMQEVCIDSD